MKSVTTLVCVLALGGAMTVSAQTKPAPAADAHPPLATATTPQLDIPAVAEAAVAVVDRFGQALATGDLGTVESLLAADVLILEAGGAERSRKEYLGHHAISDAKFLKDAHSQLTQRRARVIGDMAWVGSESELHTSKEGKALTLLSAETMVLKRTPDGWRIAHIHWSSRPKR